MTLEIYLTILSILAISAAVIGVFGLFVVSQGLRRFGTIGLIDLIFWTLVISNCLTIAASARVYSEFSYAFGDHSSIHPLANLLLRAVKLGLQGVAVLAIAMAVMKRGLPKGGLFLVIGLMLIFGAIGLSGVFGYRFYYSEHVINLFLVMLAITLSEPANPERVARHFKLMLAAVIYASLILAAIDPAKYLQSNYAGIIPGFNYRFHGLAVHANSMAPLAIVYLVLAFWVPAKKQYESLNVSAALTVLLLTQSKTNWVAALFVIVVIASIWLAARVLKDFGKGQISALSVSSIVAGMALAAYFSIHSAAFLDIGRLGDLLGLDLTSLTGRSVIWQITLEAWQRYPWFGYGGNLWNDDFRLATGFLAAGDAHNQFMQSLGETGVVGAAAWLTYVVAMLYYGTKFYARTHGASLVLVLFMLFRGISEVTFKFAPLFDMNVLIHMMVFTLLLTLARDTAERRVQLRNKQDPLAERMPEPVC